MCPAMEPSCLGLQFSETVLAAKWRTGGEDQIGGGGVVRRLWPGSWLRAGGEKGSAGGGEEGMGTGNAKQAESTGQGAWWPGG